jgi:citrate lyase beta subunit
MLSSLEYSRSMTLGGIEIGLSIESALGVANVREIADSSPRVTQVSGGSGIDMARDLEVGLRPDVDPFEYTRAEVELAVRARNLAGGAGPFLGLAVGSLDGAAAARSARVAYESGVRTAIAVHPKVALAQMDAFTPTERDQDIARQTLAHFAELRTSDDAWRVSEGRVIDAFAAAQALEVLEWAEMCRQRDGVLDTVRRVLVDSIERAAPGTRADR